MWDLLFDFICMVVAYSAILGLMVLYCNRSDLWRNSVNMTGQAISPANAGKITFWLFDRLVDIVAFLTNTRKHIGRGKQ